MQVLAEESLQSLLLALLELILEVRCSHAKLQIALQYQVELTMSGQVGLAL